MEFEWDQAKSDACLAARGFDFDYAGRVFLDPGRVVERDARFEYGEPRFLATGFIDGRLFVVVFTPRAGRIRLISARRASRREVQRHGDGSQDTDGRRQVGPAKPAA